MPCGQYPYGKCRTNNTRGLLSRPILGRLAYLNRVQSKPAPTRNYGSQDARARAIRRRALGKTAFRGNDDARYGPMFGLKQHKCASESGTVLYYHPNHGDSSDVTYFKRVGAGPYRIGTYICSGDPLKMFAGCCLGCARLYA